MNEITVLITVYNRKDHIMDLIDYYDGVNVIFLDSSDIPYDYPNGTNFILCKEKLLYESLYEGLLNVKTKYVCWNNDDDIVLKEFLASSIEFLEKNESYSNTIGFQVKKNTFYGLNEFHIWNSGNYYSENRIDRIKYMMNYFHTPAHTVMETNILKKSCSIPIESDDLYPIRYFDRIIGIVQSYYGNKKTLPYFSMIRRDGRMIDKFIYPRKLKREIPQIKLLEELTNDNSINKFLRNGLTEEEISSINFNNLITPLDVDLNKKMNMGENLLNFFKNRNDYENLIKNF